MDKQPSSILVVVLAVEYSHAEIRDIIACSHLEYYISTQRTCDALCSILRRAGGSCAVENLKAAGAVNVNSVVSNILNGIVLKSAECGC